MSAYFSGGLGLPFLRAKCDALLLKQMLRMIASTKTCFDHLTFWIGPVLGLPHLQEFIHYKLNVNNQWRLHKSPFFSYLSDIFSEARECERFDTESMFTSTTKSIYLSLTETMPPPSVVLKYPDRNFDLIFKRMISGVFSKTARTIIFLLIHERIYTRERGHRLMRNRYDSPLCGRGCGLIESQTHKYALCSWVISAWNKLLDIIFTLEPSLVFETSHDILHLNFHKTQKDNTILWLLGHYLDYVEEESVVKNNKVSGSSFQGLLSAKLLDSLHIAMPELYAIPCLTPTGIG